jgi:tripartite-type tricarboxylate transporter receptor subunit TctC
MKASLFCSQLLLCVLAICLAPSVGAQNKEQTWPVKPIRLVNPFAPGGFGDGVARPLWDQLGQALGQPILVESQAGANGALASSVVSRAAPDGHTLLLANLGPIAINPALRPQSASDPLKELVAITQIVSGPLVLVVHADFPAKDLQALIAHAKANSGKLSYGSVGHGSTTHLAGELLNLKAGLDLLQIPYKGAAPVITNILGKQIEMGFINISIAKPHLDSGQLRALGVTTLSRAAIFPNLPAIAERLPDFEVNPWWGLMAPFGTPQTVIDRIALEATKILKKADIAERFRQNGLEPEGTTPEVFAQKVVSDIAKWRQLVQTNNIKPE